MRDNEGIKIKESFKEGKGLEEKTRDNALFLSVVAQFNGDISNQLINWFKEIVVISEILDGENLSITLELLQTKESYEEIVNLVKTLDLGIDGISRKEINFNKSNIHKDSPSSLRKIIEALSNESKNKFGMSKVQIDMIHKKFDKKIS